MDPRIRPFVETLWRYHQLGHTLETADVIVVLCSHDLRVAERGAAVFLEGWAPLLVFSGGLGAITKHLWQEAEADQFARIAIGMGVPPEAILIENRSTNTGENVVNTRQLLGAKGLDPRSFILVQKPYMERRAFATFHRQWPGRHVLVTSPRVSLDEYLATYTNASLTADDVIGIMVGDLQRIRVYPERGYQIPQDVPPDVQAAYEALVKAGYDRHLLR